MRKLLGVLVVVTVALVMLVSVASAVTAVKYIEFGPLKLSIGGSRLTVSTDSLARNFNKAIVAGLEDTTLVYELPPDLIWGGVTDSLPFMVVIKRVSGTGGAADSVEAALEIGYGGGKFLPAARTDAANGWGFSNISVIGTGAGGVLVFKPGAGLSTETLNAIGKATGIPGYGGSQFRVMTRSISVAAGAGAYSLYLRYPVAVY